MSETEKYHILVVDDDERLLKLLSKYLKENSFKVSTASNAKEARALVAEFIFDLMVVDVMMPGESGTSLTQSFREQGIETPILMLTAMSELNDRIIGLESGADDYLTKPFDPRELLLRLQSILRRARLKTPQKRGVVHLGSSEYHIERGELFKEGKLVSLTSVESVLLKYLVENAEKEVLREDLGKLTQNGNERTIDVQITRLRRKIEDDPKTPRYLQTVRGKGYILLPD
ncbi:MAG: response regulator [Alphaproteobacteria bacterium]|nr:response regulator [Alphaproteobacteria bacterium]